MTNMIHKTIRALSLSLIVASCTKYDSNSETKNSLFNEATVNAAAVSTSCGSIPDDLNPTAGNKLTLQAYATGVQIYQVQRSAADPNVFVWVNIAPSAELFAKSDYSNQIGVHYAGPTWEFSKGQFKNEKVVATKIKSVLVDQTAIPWLLLKAVDSLSSPGNKITYIQRICTAGGAAPLTPPVDLGEKDSIAYTATYLFYTKD
jgi:uncharacterized protein DUF3455